MKLKLNIQRFASGTINFPNNGSMYGKIEWSSTVQGSTPEEKAQLNKSSVTAILYVKRNDGYTTYGNFSGAVSINGTSSSTFYPYLQVGNSWYEVGRYTLDVPHNADGSKSIVISGWITGPTETSWQGKTVSGAATVTLDKISRYFSQTPKVELQSATTTSATFKWTTSENASAIKYILDGGAETSCFSGDATTGTFTVSGLTAKTSHTMKINAQRKDSGLWSYSEQISFNTSNKTVRVRVNGEWKYATPYVRVNGEWKEAVPYTRVNGEWKKGI